MEKGRERRKEKMGKHGLKKEGRVKRKRMNTTEGGWKKRIEGGVKEGRKEGMGAKVKEDRKEGRD